MANSGLRWEANLANDTIAAMNSRGPLVAAICILLLPLLYVATYFANVKPGVLLLKANSYPYHYGGPWAAQMYWPVEIVDRRLRPETWDPEDTWQDVGGPGFVMGFDTVCTFVVEEEVACSDGEQCCAGPLVEPPVTDSVESETSDD